MNILKHEKMLFVSMSVALVFMFFGETLLSDLNNVVTTGFYFVLLFGAMLISSFSVVRHADSLAINLGEPYGTLILTLSVITIEVVAISTVMLTGGDNPTLARDMMFSVLMIVLNGLVGLSLLIGGFRHIEQDFNLQGVQTFLAMIMVLSVFSLILPNYTLSTSVGTFSTFQTFFIIVITLSIYFVFLFMQSMRHKSFFKTLNEETAEHDEHGNLVLRSNTYHAIFLVLYMLPIVLMSKKLAIIVDHGLSVASLPAALGGLLVAVLVLSPEGMAAIKAALNNKLQRSINVTFGSALATIALTVPAVLIISLVTGKEIILGLTPAESVLLLLTLIVTFVNFSSGKSNVLHGMLHLMLFATYFMLIFD
jgi:Ca2+:H+ antiporter